MKIIEDIKKGVFLGTILSFLGIASLLYAWVPPTQVAPMGNTVPPIHASSSNQIKNAAIAVGGLGVLGDAVFNKGIQIKSGNPGPGKVLTSDEKGNVRWEDYSVVKRIARKYKCPRGSSLMTLDGKTFCGYKKTTDYVGTRNPVAYCDTFGKSYDSLVDCFDLGHGRNHGVNKFWNGCQAWEGEKNYGGERGLLICEKSIYIPKTAADCTNRTAVLGTLNDTTVSPNPIVTCNIYKPYTYQGCAVGTQYGNYCVRTANKGDVRNPISGLQTLNATSTICPEGWMKYLNDCI